jgi:hypothetical protein
MMKQAKQQLLLGLQLYQQQTMVRVLGNRGVRAVQNHLLSCTSHLIGQGAVRVRVLLLLLGLVVGLEL